jgi:hypothetical protein
MVDDFWQTGAHGTLYEPWNHMPSPNDDAFSWSCTKLYRNLEQSLSDRRGIATFRRINWAGRDNSADLDWLFAELLRYVLATNAIESGCAAN